MFPNKRQKSLCPRKRYPWILPRSDSSSSPRCGFGSVLRHRERSFPRSPGTWGRSSGAIAVVAESFVQGTACATSVIATDSVPRLRFTSERRGRDSACGDHRSWSTRSRGCPMRRARPFPSSSPGSDRSLRLPRSGSGTGPSNPDSSRYP